VVCAHYSGGSLLLSESAGSDGRTTKLLLASRNHMLPLAALNVGTGGGSMPGLRELLAELDNFVPGGWRQGGRAVEVAGGGCADQRGRVRAHVRACVRACVRGCVRASVCVWEVAACPACGGCWQSWTTLCRVGGGGMRAGAPRS